MTELVDVQHDQTEAIICQVTNYCSPFPTWLGMGEPNVHTPIGFNWGTVLSAHGPLKVQVFFRLLITIACYSHLVVTV